jgi:type III secretion protein C
MKLNTRFSARLGAIGLSLCLSLNAAHATPVTWRHTTVHLSVDSKDLKDVLRDFTASQGIVATISPDVQGTVSGTFDLPPRKFIDTLAATFGFVWFFDGSVLSISSANDVTSQLVKLDFADTRTLQETLKQMGIDDGRFPISYDAEQGTALVTGPKRFVSLVSDLAHNIDRNADRRTGSEVRVFHLKHGWAADHDVMIDGKSVKVPGVAHILQTLYQPTKDDDQSSLRQSGGGSDASGAERLSPLADAGGQQSGGSPFAGKGGSLFPPLPGNMGGGGAASNDGDGGYGGFGGAGAASGGPGSGDADRGTGATPKGSATLPVINADAQTNTVLIRDLPDRIGQYQELIDKLDVKRQLIEIEAHVIEIDDNALKQLGVDWHARTGSVSLASNNSAGLANPAQPNFSAVLGDSGRFFLANISALESQSLAKIDSSPTVATLDNVEAAMDNKTRFFVPVQGYTSGDLYSVSTGTLLRVLPMIVNEDNTTQIKLRVYVEDGHMTGQEVSNIPVVTTSSISTEAVIYQGESLLIAGYKVDSSANGVSGVPGLSKIPVLGALFRYRQNSDSHMQRLVLLTPRVVEF